MPQKQLKPVYQTVPTLQQTHSSTTSTSITSVNKTTVKQVNGNIPGQLISNSTPNKPNPTIFTIPSISSISSGNSNSIYQPGTLSTASSITQTQTNSSQVKQFRNKIVSCKPFCQSKSTECYPIVKDASTQIDLDDIKLQHTIIPVPVPINVPIPMCMYQAPAPVPILLPVPIPVPVFIPTTKKTFDRLERRIKVIFYFELIKIFQPGNL